MSSSKRNASRPNINLNFNDPVLLKLKSLYDLINTTYSSEPNQEIAARVIHCVMFIKINSAWIKYAINNKNTDSIIYKFDSDKVKQVLRDNNNMSFHVVAYKDGDEGVKEYNAIIQELEDGIEKIIDKPALIKTFIRKIRDNDTGCMEYRLAPAMDFLLNPDVKKLDDIFHEFNNELLKQDIDPDDTFGFVSQVMKFFKDKIGSVVQHGDQDIDLTWEVIKEYLINNGYEEELNVSAN